MIAAELTLTAAHRLTTGRLPDAEPPAWIDATNNILPAIDGFDEALTLMSVLAGELIDEPESPPATLGDIVDLTSQVDDGTLVLGRPPPGTHRVFAIYENRTQHFPAGGAYPGAIEAARVIDHLDRRGTEAFLEQEFVAWIEAVADCPPRAVFVDSFELVGELPWTQQLARSSRGSLGYGIERLLPFLFLEGGESENANILTARAPAAIRRRPARRSAREDYEGCRSALFAEALIEPVCTWLHERDIELRLQSHGGYGWARCIWDGGCARI